MLSLSPALILAMVAAIYYYLKPVAETRTPVAKDTALTGPAATFAATGNTDSPATLQTSPAASGVPNTVAQVLPYANQTPGPPLSFAPYQLYGNPTGLPATGRPNYNSGRDPLGILEMIRKMQPFNIPGASSGNGKGCGGKCGGCSSAPKCVSRMNNGPCPGKSFPAPDQPVNIPANLIMEGAPAPMTLAGQLQNIASPFANPFTVFQFEQYNAAEHMGEVPAGPTYYV